MASDAEYFPNYRPNEVYIGPQRSHQRGRYVSMACEQEESLGSVQISDNVKVGIKAFYVPDKDNYTSFKIVKLKKGKRGTWRVESEVSVNNTTLSQISAFLSLLNGIEFRTTEKSRLNISQLDASSLGAVLSSPHGAQFIKRLSESPGLERDIIAVEEKRRALKKFHEMLSRDEGEREWQRFFEENSWIFGYGLDYKFLHRVDESLETDVVGSTFINHGKRADALVRTRAAVSQLVFIEIKKPSTDLVRARPYRGGCWAISDEVAGAVAQIQKTVDDFQRTFFGRRLKDEHDDDTDQYVYAVQPKSYLVVGNLSMLTRNQDKMQCFELFRRSIKSPEIITFDELLGRAECILEHISPYD